MGGSGSSGGTDGTTPGRGTGASFEPGTVVDLGTEADVIVSAGDVGLIGLRATIAGDLDGDGFDDVAIVARTALPAEGNARVAILYGSPELGGVVRLGERGALLEMESGYGKVARVGDLDDDGHDDIVLTSGQGWRCTDAHAVVHVLYGRALRIEGTHAVDDVTVRLEDEQLCASRDVWGIGDFDGDGLGDFSLPVRPFPASGRAAEPEASIVYGSRVRLVDGTLQEASAATLVSGRPGEALYWAREAGDVDGDEAGDLVLASMSDDGVNHWILFFGSKDRFYGEVDVHTTTRPGILVTGETGYWVGTIGDIDLDARSDLCVAPDELSDMYQVYYGDTDDLGASLEAGAPGSRLSMSGSWMDGIPSGVPTYAGDFNGDDLPDFLLGAANWSDGHGAALLVLGTGERLPAEADLGELAVALAGRVYPEEGEIDGAGYEISADGDINGDGLSDLLVGAPGHSDRDDVAGGRVYVVFGRR